MWGCTKWETRRGQRLCDSLREARGSPGRSVILLLQQLRPVSNDGAVREGEISWNYKKYIFGLHLQFLA